MQLLSQSREHDDAPYWWEEEEGSCNKASALSGPLLPSLRQGQHGPPCFPGHSKQARVGEGTEHEVPSSTSCFVTRRRCQWAIGGMLRCTALILQAHVQ